MGSALTPRDLKGLCQLVREADAALASITDPLPEVKSARKSLICAIAGLEVLATRYLSSAAAAMGAKGGAKAAESRKVNPAADS
jgi:hypothetical protein